MNKIEKEKIEDIKIEDIIIEKEKIEDKKMISANEINKYIYCNYQWYYERYYGKKLIRLKYILRNEKLGLYDKTTSNFNKGNDFHNSYFSGPLKEWVGLRMSSPRNIFKVIFKILIFFIIIGIILGIYFVILI